MTTSQVSRDEWIENVRAKNDYTDPIKDLIKDKLWRYFVRDGYFVVPTKAVLERMEEEQCVAKRCDASN